VVIFRPGEHCSGQFAVFGVEEQRRRVGFFAVGRIAGEGNRSNQRACLIFPKTDVLLPVAIPMHTFVGDTALGPDVKAGE